MCKKFDVLCFVAIVVVMRQVKGFSASLLELKK